MDAAKTIGGMIKNCLLLSGSNRFTNQLWYVLSWKNHFFQGEANQKGKLSIIQYSIIYHDAMSDCDVYIFF